MTNPYMTFLSDDWNVFIHPFSSFNDEKQGENITINKATILAVIMLK